MSTQQVIRLWCDDSADSDPVETCQSMYNAGVMSPQVAREHAAKRGWTCHVVQPGATIVDYCPACSERRAKTGQRP